VTQFILDDQLALGDVLGLLRRRVTVAYLREVRRDQVIKDERVASILHTIKHPTFITIDDAFWDRRLRHNGYCMLYFVLRHDEQRDLPELLHRLLRLPEFRTRAARMGRVARVSREQVLFWQLHDETLHAIEWPSRRRPQ
jgi:hypothetical protein